MNVALLVAAGYGRRFDPTGGRSKLEALIGSLMVAVRTAQPLLSSCDHVIAAVRPESTRLAQALAAAGCEIALVTGEEGMGNSIACGARAAARFDALRMLLVQPADMPWLRTHAVRQVLQATAGDDQPIVVPTFRGRDGHPVRFDRRLVPALSRLSGERGARQLLLSHPTLRIRVDDDGVVRDLDTPEDLAPGLQGKHEQGQGEAHERGCREEPERGRGADLERGRGADLERGRGADLERGCGAELEQGRPENPWRDQPDNLEPRQSDDPGSQPGSTSHHDPSSAER